MFFIQECVLTAVAAHEAYKREARMFNELCKTLPGEQAEELMRERKKRRDEELKHSRNLEVARESRSLNFWGNR